MDIDEIKTLTQLMVDNDLSEIIIRDGDKRVMLKRRGAGLEHMIHAAPIHQPVAFQATPPAPGAMPPAAAPPVAANDGLLKITSPMVGTFYSAANPDSPPFIKIGDRINPESVVCIIEAMKVFNEIKAEISGVVESIEVQNGSPVEFGQVLIRVRPG